MKRLVLTLSILLGCLSICFAQIEKQFIPIDAMLRKGVLGNGMTYYVRKAKPEGKSELRLVVNVGSLSENDKELGIAHFVEHMMFKGTKHFPGNSAVEYLRHCGIFFGPDANALTKPENTTYIISDLPTSSESRLDSCLLLMRDWAADATIDDADVESERNVIVEEWRTKSVMSFANDLYQAIFAGTQYAERIPIGSMDVIQHCSPKVVRNFYKRWYQPQNMAIIATGDFDTERVEQKIKDLFADIKKGKNLPSDYDLPAEFTVPQVYSFETRLIPYVSSELIIKMPGLSAKEAGTVGSVRQEYTRKIIATLLNNKLVWTRKANPNILSATAKITPFMNITPKARMMYAISASAPENWKESVELIFKAIEQMRRTGFTEQTWEKRMCPHAYALYNNDSTVLEFPDTLVAEGSVGTSKELADKYIDNFLYSAPHLHANSNEYIAEDYAYSTLTMEQANSEIAKIFDGRNMYLCFTVPEGKHKPTQEEVMAIQERVRGMSDEELFDDEEDKPKEPKRERTIQDLGIDPVPGTVVSQVTGEDGCTELMLSNGVKVFLQSVADESEEISVKLMRKGGFSMLGDEDLIYGRFFSQSLESYQSTYRLTCTDFFDSYSFTAYDKKALEGKLKEMHVLLTSTEVDTVKFNEQVGTMKMLSAVQTSPLTLKALKVLNLYKVDAKRDMPLSVDKMESLSIERFKAVAKDYLSNYNGAAVAINGNFDVDSIMPHILKYIASLPSKPESTNIIDRPSYHFKNKPETLVEVIENATPLAEPYLFYAWEKGYQFTQDNHAHGEVLNSVLGQLLLDIIRVKNSDVYTPKSAYQDYMQPVSRALFMIGLDCNPESCDRIINDIKQMLNEMAEGSLISQDLINNYISEREKKLPTNKKGTMEHASERLDGYFNNGIVVDDNDLTYIKQVTPASLKAYVKALLTHGNLIIGKLTTK